ncbi:MAG: hypothetical protein HC905_12330 [Bacteroidales bacterium]|nr:hypothetical protein [Bacteroidales bacterium]
MRKSKFIFGLLLLISCNKHDNELDTQKCINGDWNCISGVEIINSDTVEFFQHGIKYYYWYGQKDYSNTGYINLLLDNNGQYHFLENILGNQMDTTMVGNIFNYTLDWRLLNTTKSNTHINLRIYFLTDQIFSSVFKIEELSDKRLIIVSDEDYYYMKYEFERADNGCIDNKFSQQIDQNPQNIIGNWLLKEYLYSTSDSVFTKYINDTLYVQYYESIHGIPYPIKIVDNYNYINSISLKNIGDLYTIEKEIQNSLKNIATGIGQMTTLIKE